MLRVPVHLLRTCLLTLLSCGAFAAPAAAAPGPAFLGAQVHPLWSSHTPAVVSREIGLLADLGVNVARIDVGWSTLQSEGPRYWADWYVEKLDHFVAEAGKRRIKVIATLTETPCWASSAPARLKRGCEGRWWERGVQDHAPADFAGYGRAARFLTARYGTRLAALEVWNEPNLSYEFISPNRAAKVRSYTALVRATYRQAKAGNRSVPVLAGSLAYSDKEFLEALYRAGIRGHYDGIAIHPYSDGRPPDSLSAPVRLEFAGGIASIRAAQLAAGDSTPIWLTEFGWTSCPGCIGLDSQASSISQAVRMLPSMPYVRGASLYKLRDTGDDPRDWENNFGLLRNDFSRRPAYAAFRSAVRSVLGARARATATRAPTSISRSAMFGFEPGG